MTKILPKILVVGAFNLDIVAYAKQLPHGGESRFADDVQYHCGGKGFNQAVAAHKACGTDGQDIVAFASFVGDDGAEQHMYDFMSDAKMPTNYIITFKGQHTGNAFIWVNSQTAENQILVYAGANHYRDPMLDLSAYFDETLKHVEYVVLQNEIHTDYNQFFMDMAVQKGYKLLLNPGPAKAISKENLSTLWAITPNEHEAAILCDRLCENMADYQECASYLHDAGVQLVLITLGKKGVYYSYNQAQGIIPACKVDAVDTVGAGDCFNGYFIAGMYLYKDIKKAIVYGVQAAAISVQSHGAAISMPMAEDVQKLL